MEKFSRKRYW